MKNILITGVRGYLSTALKKYFQDNKDWNVTLLNLRDDSWKKVSFYKYDTIVHCAALVHKKENNRSIQEYRDINVVLTNELALKAKREGVKHFVFMSTRAVYGLEGSCFKTVVIDENTVLKPKSKYGITKLEAERILSKMESENFKVCIIRAPFIYGPGCPGNYNTLRKLVLKVGIIPKLQNQYSMMYIGNLCSLISHCVERKIQGILTPQDLPFHSTAEMALLIAKYNEKKVIYTNMLNPLIKLGSIICKPIRTAFGSEIYDENMSFIEGVNYYVTEFEASIEVTEKKR